MQTIVMYLDYTGLCRAWAIGSSKNKSAVYERARKELEKYIKTRRELGDEHRMCDFGSYDIVEKDLPEPPSVYDDRFKLRVENIRSYSDREKAAHKILDAGAVKLDILESSFEGFHTACFDVTLDASKICRNGFLVNLETAGMECEIENAI